MSAPEMRTPGGGQANASENTNAADVMRSYAKRKSTVTAELAMKGHAVHDGPCGDFSVCRWGLAKYCQDLEALENFAVVVGARGANA